MYMHVYACNIMLSCTGARPRPLLSMCTLVLVHVHVCLCLHYAVMHRSLPSMTMKLRKKQCRSQHQTVEETDLRYDLFFVHCHCAVYNTSHYCIVTACICTSTICGVYYGVFIYDIVFL